MKEIMAKKENLHEYDIDAFDRSDGYIVYKIDKWSIAIAINRIYRMVEWDDAKSSIKKKRGRKKADDYLLGEIDVEGKKVPVFDIASFFDKAYSVDNGLIVLCMKDDGKLIGIRFEDIDELRFIEEDTVNRNITNKVGFNNRFVNGFSAILEQIIIFIDLERIN